MFMTRKKRPRRRGQAVVAPGQHPLGSAAPCAAPAHQAARQGRPPRAQPKRPSLPASVAAAAGGGGGVLPSQRPRCQR